MRTRKHKGFTLVEILIVVVILGILAAIVIPQFSEASTEARLNSLASNLQTMRSQLSLYKVQHNDTPPALGTFDDQMTKKTLQNGTVDAAGTFGPYLQTVPRNPFKSGDPLVVAVGADAANAHWLYDASTGAIYASRTGLTEAQIAEIGKIDPLPTTD